MKASEYSENRKKYWQSQGLKLQEAKGKANLDVRAFLGNKTEGYVSQLKTISASPVWVHELIRQDLIACETVRIIADKAKKIQKTNPTITLDFIYAGIRAIASVDNNRQEIKPVDVEAYFTSFGKTEDSEGGGGKNKVINTLQELLDTNKITDDACQGANTLVTSDTVKEVALVKGLIALLTEEKTILTMEDVKTVQDTLAPKLVTVDEFDKVSKTFSKSLETIDYSGINEVEVVNKDVGELINDSIKYLGSLRHFPTGDVKKALHKIIELVELVNEDDATVFGDKLPQMGTPTLRLKQSIIDRLEVIDRKLTANRNSKTATVEVEEVDDEENEDSDEYEPSDAVTAEEGEYIAEIED
jgi:hypothetical protein